MESRCAYVLSFSCRPSGVSGTVVASADLGRVLRVAQAFAAEPHRAPEARLCQATAKLVDAHGVGLAVGASGDLLDSGLQTICATTGAQKGEALQFDLGEGPSYTAHRTGWPVRVPDLEKGDSWPAFTKASTAAGLRAVFAFPLRSGSIAMGTLTLYQRVAGELTTEQYTDAMVAARVALNLLTSLQAGRSPDELAGVFTDSLSHSVEVHQASGIISVQLDIPVSAALAVLRAHAFAEGSSLAEVATQVTEHRLMLGPLPE